jgi:diguanylate cyclase (GGDEF)-like protein
MFAKFAAGRLPRGWQGLGRIGAWAETATARLRARLACGKPSLVNRLSAFLLAGTIIIYLIGIAGLYASTSDLVNESLRKQAVQWITEMDQLGTSLYFSRKPDVAPIEKRVRSVAEISYVRYYDSTGQRILGRFGDHERTPERPLSAAEVEKLSSLARTDTPYLLDKPGRADELVHIVSSVRVRSIRSDGMLNFNLADAAETVKVIGYVDVAIDPSSYRAQLHRSVGIGSALTAIVLLIAIVIGRTFIRRALRPLTALQMPLARLARGEIDVSVATGGDSEIASIADALNVTIGALKQRNEALHRLAERDALTGLFNRNYFTRVLDTELAWVKRGKMTSALLFIDLDRFKYVNDTLGHGAGDRLLVEVAERIKARMRAHDIVSRFGGDEFTVVAHEVSADEARRIAQGILDVLLDYRFVEQEQTFTISCTIGIAMMTAASRSTEELMSQADAACYEAKSAGRNQYFLYEPDAQQKQLMETDIGWSQRIKDAIKGEGFSLFYQPIVDLGAGRQEIYEVLLRMSDRHGKTLMPDAFLPVAERFGLLPDIDRWVITHALRALAQARADGREVAFSINLSSQALADAAVVQLIRDGLKLNGVPGTAVIFELTEQTAVRFLDRTRQLTQSLIDLGCRFALDDFGVGFSSFATLKRLPVALIKVDGSFIRNLATEPVDQVMVKSIVEIAKALGKQVVAEFVQNEACIEMLRSYGVDYVQGSHLGRPTESLPPRPPRRDAELELRRARRSGAGVA